MKVELAKMAGFCFGVNRAVDTVYQEAADHSPVYTYGPIIHNEEVIADLERKGVQVIHSLEEAKEQPEGTIIIRSHGVTKAEQDALMADGLRVVDATCPFVKKIHRLVQEYSDKGYLVIIIGSGDHPEVQGIVGWSHSERTVVVNCASDVEKLDLKLWKKVCIVAQTTFNYNKFQELVEIIQKKGYDSESTVDKDSEIIVHNTICSATKERQEAAKELSAKVDAMLVIGGLSSSNTRKLYEICSENCRNTYFIQTKEDLENSDFSRFGYVGIAAGASTPNNIIEEVQKYVRNEF
ncbi:4-hydroxy-3-methylbut-2-enyl diphosphate reductase [uncultured Eubacterium sp.]|uniref:4-hydroxy-3-methylbut-2-enyl diphosphate reductase n=1 Tax=uncultured Eubacterium sp. TaxID=165185 RepID=UPI0025ECD29D|nr:4-hydroxy-3-methylbut-2-enyl diphosphate reductase [uncultured Eubacterium sp.]